MDPIIDQALYKHMLANLNRRMLYDCSMGTVEDMEFIKEDNWLSDSVVIEHLSMQKGTWTIGLLFAHVHNPLKLIIRMITNERSQSRAKLVGQLLRRQAAKDQRGTLKLDEDYFKIKLN